MKIVAAFGLAILAVVLLFVGYAMGMGQAHQQEIVQTADSLYTALADGDQSVARYLCDPKALQDLTQQEVIAGAVQSHRIASVHGTPLGTPTLVEVVVNRRSGSYLERFQHFGKGRLCCFEALPITGDPPPP